MGRTHQQKSPGSGTPICRSTIDQTLGGLGRSIIFLQNTRIKNNILCMRDRRLHHSLTLMFKITKNIAPTYLCNRITQHSAIHNYNTRRRNEIVTPFARSRARTLSFFIEIPKIYNTLSRAVSVSNISVQAFKSKCSKYLRDMDS